LSGTCYCTHACVVVCFYLLWTACPYYWNICFFSSFSFRLPCAASLLLLEKALPVRDYDPPNYFHKLAVSRPTGSAILFCPFPNGRVASHHVCCCGCRLMSLFSTGAGLTGMFGIDQVTVSPAVQKSGSVSRGCFPLLVGCSILCH
jgi:hypothetical protein